MPKAFKESIAVRRLSSRALAVLLGTTALVSSPYSATAKDWNGDISVLWSDALNWGPAGQPTAADDVIINKFPSTVQISGGLNAVANELHIRPGDRGGSLTIVDNSSLTLGDKVILGEKVGTHGTVTVGAGSLMFVDHADLVVGDRGKGALVVENGGYLSVGGVAIGRLILGRDAGGSGKAFVDGSGSRISAGGFILVGDLGNGELTITNGGAIEGVHASIGHNVGGAGAALVSGAGSRWENSGDILVGSAGDGSLTIAGGGVVKGNTGIIGHLISGTGRVIVDGTGSRWDTTSTLIVGAIGTGTLTIVNGGAVQSGSGELGATGTGVGTATVDGAGSNWTAVGGIQVGTVGKGILTISNGGRVTSDGSVIGTVAGSSGTATVDGAGSTWQVSQEIFVGFDGAGSLTISNGGSVTNTYGMVGLNPGGEGSVLITGPGSSWTNSMYLSVGFFGTGRMTISNGGSVSSARGFVGDLAGSSGKVIVDGAGSNWTVADTLWVGGSGNGTLTVSNGGSVHVGSTLTIASVMGSVGELNIGAAPGAQAVGAGVVSTGQIAFGAGTGSINFNHTETAYDFSVKMSGTGTINQLSGTTILSGDSSAFTGVTMVQGGTLAVNGSLGGTLDVLAGGRLQGIGRVGNTSVFGTIAPGNSIGTLNVAGNITFNAGSTYEVEGNAAGQADRIHATGTAAINGGSVKVLAGNYAPATQYTILTANGGRAGTFETVTSNLVFLDPTLSYDPNNVYLTLARNSVAFESVGLTRNQRAVGGVIESLNFGNPVWDAMVQLDAPGARAAFDQLSGEIHASARTALIEDSRFVRNAVNDRLRAAFDSVGASRGLVAAYASGTPQAVPATTERLAVWGQGFGSWGHTNGDGNAARLNRSTGGFFTGVDAPAFDTWRFGAVAGYGYTDFDVRDRRSSGSSDNYHVGLYSGAQWGNLALRTGAAYTWHDISTGRSVAFPGFTDSLKSNYNAGTTQVFGELGHDIRTGNVAFEPFANLAYVSLYTDGFTEKGGAAALSGVNATTDATFTTLGLRTSSVFTLGEVAATARGMLGWRHAFGDVTPVASMAFAGASPFSIGGVPITRDAAVVEAGLDFALSPAATLGVSYGGQFGSGLSDQSVRANFLWKF